MRNLSVLWLVIISGVLVSCSGNRQSQKSNKINLTENQLIQLNKKWVEQENTKIDDFIKQKQWNMKETSTGLRYMIYSHGNGEGAKIGEIATIKYSVSLLDGTVVYSSAQSGLKTFRIGHSTEVSGLEEGIILLKVGDKAKFLLPSHLAYGLSGDGRKIPPDVPIIYDVELVQLK
ncbi:MAG: FKBP-type peptidyl-prolyl cis-trans isomerase [Bacteroidales bacterium]|nr:FKBP-type peptidyl-prolyl cis-trans isomerase [Bacteroidales bacterium]